MADRLVHTGNVGVLIAFGPDSETNVRYGPAVSLTRHGKLAGDAREHSTSVTTYTAIAVVNIHISKNSFHIVELDGRGAIVLRQK